MFYHSGSGKTTLMSTISHRTKGWSYPLAPIIKTGINVIIVFVGNFEGELLLNGRPVSEDIMIKISGFVAQEDVSFVQLTVLEQLNLMVSTIQQSLSVYRSC